MKRILFFLLLLVNLQLTTDKGSLGIGVGEVFAQRINEEQLSKDVTRSSDGPWTCIHCGMNCGGWAAWEAHEATCTKQTGRCPICKETYDSWVAHFCGNLCPKCNRPLNMCTCNATEVVGKKPGGSFDLPIIFDDDDDDDFYNYNDDAIYCTIVEPWYTKAIKYLNDSAYSWEVYQHLPEGKKGNCAKRVREALKAAGIDTSGHPNYAKNYGPLLQRNGFKEISPKGYWPKEGDIRVWQNAPGTNKAGHIHIYDGYQWVSDFFEPNPDGPNAKYRKNPNYKIYRKEK